MDLDTHTGPALWISPHTDFRTTSTRKSVIRSYPHVLPHEPALARPIARGTLRLSWQVKKGEQESPTAHELVHFLEVQLSMGALPWLLSPGGQDMNPCYSKDIFCKSNHAVAMSFRRSPMLKGCIPLNVWRQRWGHVRLPCC